ncbi:unnamed protein product [Allacma fusca]|uniref:Uncharacterized protein n=1 Tax=Allacma fusca TaxID=39272 RepID=A0A8J2KUS6_9HEXA|nr:unnamed protein product [Allacma fusca]
MPGLTGECRTVQMQDVPPGNENQCQPSGTTLRTALTIGFCGTIIIGLALFGTFEVLKTTSIAKDVQLISTSLVSTQTTSQPQLPEVVSEMADSDSQDQLIPLPIRMRLSVSAPTDLLDLPKAGEIYLTVNNSKSVPWENWFPQNVDKVVLLRLYGSFSLPNIQHFLSIINKAATLCIYNVNMGSCRKRFKKTLIGKTLNESNSSSAEVSTARYITSSKHVRPLAIGAPTDIPDFPESYEIHLKILNTQGVRWENWFPLNADKASNSESPLKEN